MELHIVPLFHFIDHVHSYLIHLIDYNIRALNLALNKCVKISLQTQQLTRNFL